MCITIDHDPNTHAGDLDDETLSEIWDHLFESAGDPKVPEFTEQTLQFFKTVNGVVPINTFANGVRVVRFLNFCNDYFSGNASIADWHIVRNRRWIADRLDPYVIPIAELAHGDYLCLDFENALDPKVIRWDHERSSPGNPCYYPVSSSLSEFIRDVNANVA